MELVRVLYSRLKNMKPIMGVAAAGIIAFSMNVPDANAKSECFDHWNGDAWHGSGGWALVLCLDSATMTACEVRLRDGEKIVVRADKVSDSSCLSRVEIRLSRHIGRLSAAAP